MNLLITGAWTDAQKYIPAIEQNGHKVVFMQNETDPLPVSAEWVEGVIGNGLFLHHSMQSFVNLKYIQLTSAGYDRVPLSAIEERKIVLHNARGVYSAPMAEFCIAGILYFYKSLRVFGENQRNHSWQKCRDLQELSDKVVCIVGCGSVGQACAVRLQSFGCRICGVDIHTNSLPYFDSIVPTEDIDEVLANADVVVLCAPHTEQTHDILNAGRINRLKSQCVVINLARGELLDEDALLRRVRSKELFAVLDVHQQEPLPSDSPWWDTDRALITPHNSFVGEHNGPRLSRLIMDNLKGC